MDRLIGNPHLRCERLAIYLAMTQWRLQSLPMPLMLMLMLMLMLIDWSPLTDDQRQQLWRASLPVGGRSPYTKKSIPGPSRVTAQSSKGTEIERHIKVNSASKPPYSVIFLGRIVCRYVVFDLPAHYIEWAQAMLVRYFQTLEVD